MTIFYIGGLYEVEVTNTTVTKQTWYYPAGGAIRVIDGGGDNVFYVLKDHLGSASVTLDAGGSPVAEMRFYPFGEVRVSTGATPTDKTFQSQRDVGLGLMHFGARFYHPRLGRFVSADTIVPNFADPQALNRYAFVLNNPLKYIDPTGHTSACATNAKHKAPADDCADYREPPKPTPKVEKCNSFICSVPSSDCMVCGEAVWKTVSKAIGPEIVTIGCGCIDQGQLISGVTVVGPPGEPVHEDDPSTPDIPYVRSTGAWIPNPGFAYVGNLTGVLIDIFGPFATANYLEYLQSQPWNVILSVSYTQDDDGTFNLVIANAENNSGTDVMIAIHTYSFIGLDDQKFISDVLAPGQSYTVYPEAIYNSTQVAFAEFTVISFNSAQMKVFIIPGLDSYKGYPAGLEVH